MGRHTEEMKRALPHLVVVASLLVPLGLACSSAPTPTSELPASAPSDPGAVATGVSSDDARVACVPLPFAHSGREWVGLKGARPVWWWDGGRCIERNAPFGVSGIPLRCDGPGCRALFDAEQDCLEAHARCESRKEADR